MLKLRGLITSSEKKFPLKMIVSCIIHRVLHSTTLQSKDQLYESRVSSLTEHKILEVGY